MFVDVGRVDGGDPEYLSWDELATMQDSGRWQLQLHSGKGHTQIHYGPGPDDYGPFYAYEQRGERLRRLARPRPLRHRLGPATLADHISAYRPLAFAPPYGSYGQDGTNDPRIPDDLLGWLTRSLRRRLHPGRQRACAAGERTAARPDPGHPRDHRRRPARTAALRELNYWITVGLTTYDAKVPDTSFPPIVQPPAGAPNELVVMLAGANQPSLRALMRGSRWAW